MYQSRGAAYRWLVINLHTDSLITLTIFYLVLLQLGIGQASSSSGLLSGEWYVPFVPCFAPFHFYTVAKLTISSTMFNFKNFC
jgi:hypothetical protein